MLRSRFATGVIRKASTDRHAARIGGLCTRAFCLLVLAFATVAMVPAVQARPYLEVAPAQGDIRAAELPPEGRQVLAEIRAGGPFGSPRDGITFGNREGFLPRQKRGYYAEYTVSTPGARNRAARRIIAGRGQTGDFRTSSEYYYTNDHYQSFRRIVQ